MTDLLCQTDAYLRRFSATMTGVDDGGRVTLDRSAFYPTGGGQPHDTGVLRWAGGETSVVAVTKEGGEVWHRLEGDLPPAGTEIEGEIDWDRRYSLMRTHTALHVLCGVIWNHWGTAVTGGNMEPGSARMDFEFDPLPEGFGPTVEELVNTELAKGRPVEVAFLPRAEAVLDEALPRARPSSASASRSSTSDLRLQTVQGEFEQPGDGEALARGLCMSETGWAEHTVQTPTTGADHRGDGGKRERVFSRDGRLPSLPRGAGRRPPVDAPARPPPG